MAEGIVIVDKPEGWTSHDVVAKLRGILRERRVGHGGTLDPMATGVLPVFVGRATRGVEFVESGEKEYLAGLRLGLITDTQDTTGTILEKRPVQVEMAQLEQALAPFRGEILQVPPMYSAVKVGGKKLYELARKGQEVERRPRPVTIHRLEVVGQNGPETYQLRIVCSKGTYVRTLCHEIGLALGCGGAMCSLRRIRAAGFTLEQAVSLEKLAAAGRPGDYLLPVDSLFARLPALTVEGAAEKKIRNGAAVPLGGAPGEYRVYGADGSFLMLGRLEAGRLGAVKNFFAPG